MYNEINCKTRKGRCRISWLGYKWNDGSPGKAYTIDPNTETVNAMIAQGAYIVSASENDYNSDGYPGVSTTSYTTTVSLTNYTVSYNTNGGTTTNQGRPSYTIETTDFILPTVTKKVTLLLIGHITVIRSIQQLCQQRQTV